MSNLKILYRSAQNTKQEIINLDKENKRLAKLIEEYRNMELPSTEKYEDYDVFLKRYSEEYAKKEKDLKTNIFVFYPLAIAILVVLCKLFGGSISAALFTQCSFIIIGISGKLKKMLPIKKKIKIANVIVDLFKLKKDEEVEEDEVKCLDDMVQHLLGRQHEIVSMTEELTEAFEEYCDEVQKAKGELATEVMREHNIPAQLTLTVEPTKNNKVLNKKLT